MNSGPQVNGSAAVSKNHARLLAAFAALDMVSAYHAFHDVGHGQERHHTYRHTPKDSTPWHIDFCFVPKAWAACITNVELLDGDEWRAESDHHPLKVDLGFA